MNSSKPKVLIRSLVISYLMSGILLLILSFALYKLKLREDQINTSVYGVYAAACFIGGLLSGKSIRSRRFFWGMLTGLLYFAVLFAVSWLMRQGSAPTVSQIMTVMACCIAGGTIGGMVS